MKLTGNKGEWSELYVLIRLLADGKLLPANDIADSQNLYLPILRIFRNEDAAHQVEYRISRQDFIELYLNDNFVRKISTVELSRTAQDFLHAIINGQGEGSFAIEGAESVMKNLCCQEIKAPSREKADIAMELHDPFTNFNRICGFSIKSDLGSAPTLFNASQATNFKFEVFGVSDEQMQAINSINTNRKVIDRIKRIPEIKFIEIVDSPRYKDTFAKNLLFVDTQMSIILAEMLKLFYVKNISACAVLATELEEKDIFGLEVKNLYRHKIKKFLCAVALGFTPTDKWDGTDEANGGYIIVKESGSVTAYHLYNRDSFETYLLNNTKLETASTGKHKFGSIYVEDGRKFINLNLQVRFLSS